MLGLYVDDMFAKFSELVKLVTTVSVHLLSKLKKLFLMGGGGILVLGDGVVFGFLVFSLERLQ